MRPSSQYGFLMISDTGAWTYILNNATAQRMTDGQQLTDTVTVQSMDGSGQDIVITITGTNDKPVVSGVVAGTVSEDGILQASGALSAVDVDTGESGFQAGDLTGQYGALSLSGDGAWNYTLDNASVQFLTEGQQVTDSLTVRTVDGSEQVLAITIDGANDAPEITGDMVTSLMEDDSGENVSGQLTVTDVDSGDSGPEAGFRVEKIIGQYGTLNIGADGLWRYVPDDFNTQSLAEGQQRTDILTVHTLDGSEQDITVTITGSNDVPIIAGQTTGATVEDGIAEISGLLTVSDVDTDESSFLAETLAGQYGSLSINTAGAWTYNLDNTIAQPLVAGEIVSEVLTVNTVDGTGQTITLTVTGTGDAPAISGDMSGGVTEDGLPQVGGTLLATDADAGESGFRAETLTGQYGSLSINAAGTWTYNLDSAIAQPLTAGEVVSDTLTVHTIDGTEQTITLTVTGTNDAPVISGDVSGSVTEDSLLQVGGALLAVDADAGESGFRAGTLAGQYGSLAINATGAWGYSLSNDDVQSLPEGERITDTVTVRTIDGSTQDIAITITGTNDTPTLGGVVTGVVTEDGELQASGTATVTDIDSGESWFQAGTLTGQYGSLAIGANGAWIYSLDNTAVQSLAAGETVNDALTVHTIDGTEQTITLTVTGAEDAPVISGDVSGAVTEDDQIETSGALSAVSADAGGSAFRAETLAGQYGSLAINATGAWTYTLSNDDVQSLSQDQQRTDTLTVRTAGGVSQDIAITITGTDDIPVLGGAITGAVSEDDVLQVTGTATAIDADSGESGFRTEILEGQYGGLAIGPAGTWTYTLDNGAAQSLAAGEVVNDTLMVHTVDGTAQAITLTVTGAEDATTISGDLSGSVTEDDLLEISGALSAVNSGSGEVGFQAETLAGQYGLLTIDAAGAWRYALSNDDVQSLPESQQLTDTITVQTTDGSTQDVTITITGANDAPVVGGVLTGAVSENGMLQAMGMATAVDADSGESGFRMEMLTGQYGSLFIGDTGTWIYTLDSSAAQPLAAGEVVDDALTVHTIDGTEQTITLTVTGAGSAPTISGDLSGSVAEDSLLQATGTLTVVDADAGESSFQAEDLTGQYGALSIDAEGVWRYVQDNANTQSLKEGQQVTDTLTVRTVDGSGQDITVTITGSNDTPAITGQSTGNAVEDGPVEVSGQLAVSDVDTDESSFQAETLTGQHGTLAIGAAGAWTYSLDNDADAVQSLPAGETLTDAITVRTLDGTEQAIALTITGENDAPVVADTVTLDADEDYVRSGQLTASDPDQGAELTFSLVSGPSAGVLALDPDGTWIFNPLGQFEELNDGDTQELTFDYSVSDGLVSAPGTANIAIHGRSDDDVSLTVKALLSGRSWSNAPGEAVLLKYAFPTESQSTNDLPDHYATDPGLQNHAAGFVPFTAAQQAAALTAMESWSHVANIKFEQAASVAEAQILFGVTDLPNAQEGYAFYPGDREGGDVWLDANTAANLTPGSRGYMTLVHEIGHALGLKHGGDYGDETSLEPAIFLPADEDIRENTVMAYGKETAGPDEPRGPQAYDIQAIQYLYGANPNTNSGDTVYDLATDGHPFQVIVDADGVDTLDASDVRSGVTINLNPGSNDLVEGFDLVVAKGTLIENAIGSDYADSLIGNGAFNVIRGMGGDDSVVGNTGNDVLVGGDISDELLASLNNRYGIIGDADGDGGGNVDVGFGNPVVWEPTGGDEGTYHFDYSSSSRVKYLDLAYQTHTFEVRDVPSGYTAYLWYQYEGSSTWHKHGYDEINYYGESDADLSLDVTNIGRVDYDIYNSSNNHVKTFTWYVDELEPAKPDLDLTSISLPNGTSYYPGGSMEVDFTVKNIGNQSISTVTSIEHGIYLSTNSSLGSSDQRLAQETSWGLSAGSSKSESDTFNLPNLSPGSYYIIVNTDDNSDVSEKSETNNTIYKQFTVSEPPKPDLDISSASLRSSSIVQGDNVTIDYVVKNYGSGSADSSRAGIYIDGVYEDYDSVSSLSAGGTSNESNSESTGRIF
uniref:VCBS repeat-containing protein n=1 Tax=Candidatus Kentrum sp. DK TaxID=2126562 RepID=A0A450TGZ5_9GAMM|nr:MAG: VCBS repeat-containing protein [Candidatus Kentron sp. DK]